MTNFHYYTVKNTSSFEIEPIKKSRFIAHLLPLTMASELSAHLLTIRQRYPNANHHGWAYHLLADQQIRFSDDGEPAGTAGKPILNHLQGNRLINAGVIVTRIFGGTKLGVGGLVRAYGQAAGAVIINSHLIPFIPAQYLSFTYQYAHTLLIEQTLHTLKLKPLHSAFDNMVTLSFEIPVTEYDATVQNLLEMTQNRIVISAKYLK